MLQTIVRWLQMHVGLETELQWRLVMTLGMIIVLLLARIGLLKVIEQLVTGDLSQYRWRKGVEITVFIVGAVTLARLWLTATEEFATYIGLMTAGMAIALQDPLTNLVGWLFLVWRRPFEVGDRIQVGNQAGDVIDIRFFQFTLMEIRDWVDADQSTGRILHLPNRRVFNDNVANFTKGFAYIWNEIAIELTFESDWRLAKSELQTIAERHSLHLTDAAREKLQETAKHYLVNYRHLTPIVYTEVKASGVLLTIRYLTDPRKRRTSSCLIWEDVLDTFADNPAIEFAYPTQRHIVETTIETEQIQEKGRKRILTELFTRQPLAN